MSKIPYEVKILVAATTFVLTISVGFWVTLYFLPGWNKDVLSDRDLMSSQHHLSDTLILNQLDAMTLNNERIEVQLDHIRWQLEEIKSSLRETRTIQFACTGSMEPVITCMDSGELQTCLLYTSPSPRDS